MEGEVVGCCCYWKDVISDAGVVVENHLYPLCSHSNHPDPLQGEIIAGVELRMTGSDPVSGGHGIIIIIINTLCEVGHPQ